MKAASSQGDEAVPDPGVAVSAVHEHDRGPLSASSRNGTTSPTPLHQFGSPHAVAGYCSAGARKRVRECGEADAVLDQRGAVSIEAYSDLRVMVDRSAMPGKGASCACSRSTVSLQQRFHRPWLGEDAGEIPYRRFPGAHDIYAAGRVKKKVDPSPGVDSTRIGEGRFTQGAGRGFHSCSPRPRRTWARS